MTTADPTKPLRFKLREIILPGLGWAAIFCVVYSLLHWLLVLRTEWLALDEELLRFWLPLLLPWLPILLLLRRRIQLVRWQGREDAFAGYLCAWLLFAAPTIVAQHYLESTTGTLARYPSIEALRGAEPARFYTFTNFSLDTSATRPDAAVHPVGRHNEDLKLTVYLVCPLRDGPRAGASVAPAAWCMQEFSETISNRLDQASKQRTLRSLVERSARQFESLAPADIRYFKRLRSGEALRACQSVIRGDVAPASLESPLILEAHFDDWKARGGSTLGWIFGAFAIGAAVWSGFAAFGEIHPLVVRLHQTGVADAASKEDSALELLRPRRGFIVTPALLCAVSLVFAAMVLAVQGFNSFRTQDLVAWGGAFRPAVQDGEVWRLLVAGFLHDGFLHLTNNAVGLWLCGVFAEPVAGWKWYLGTFLASIVVGNWASLVWSPAAVSVGASGGVFGLIGFALPVVWTRGTRVDAEHRVSLLILLAYGGANLVLGFFMPGVANAAHLGGLATGAFLGWIAAPRLKPSTDNNSDATRT